MGVLVSPVSGPGLDDGALADAGAAGDAEAWAALFDRHVEQVWQVAFGVLRRRSEAEDVVQATFLEAVDSIEDIPDPITLRPWLLAIARRRAVSVADRVERAADDPATGTGNAAALVRLVATAFDSLSGRERAALELSDRQDLAGAELHAALWLTADRAATLIVESRIRLEDSVVSLLRLREGRRTCDSLRVLLEETGTDDPAVIRRRKVARHLNRCDGCADWNEPPVHSATLVALLPVVAMSEPVLSQARASTLEAAAGFALGPSGEGIWLDHPSRPLRRERRTG